jgi:adenosylcobinamide kinase/adenosylcobinamide-phosphate guanylyltransferase
LHFVTGGAFNGKRKWVADSYKLQETQNYTWISPFRQGFDFVKLSDIAKFQTITIIEGLEELIKMGLEQDQTDLRITWTTIFRQWLSWEQQNDHNILIVIGSDITKGIVPIEKRDREWRDLVGWCYQDLMKICHRADLIWYGVAQPLKREDVR